MSISLTSNAVLAINNGEIDSQPVLQVLDVRQIGTGQSVQERYRLMLSDGVYTQQGMLATQLNEHIKSGHVLKGSIVRLVEYICNTVQQRKIIIILNMEVIQSVSEIIGDPKQVIMKAPSIPSSSTVEAGAEGHHPSIMQATAPVLSPQRQPNAHTGMSNVSYGKNCIPSATKAAQTGGFRVHGDNAGGDSYLATNAPYMPSHGQINSNLGRPMRPSTSYQPSTLYTGGGLISQNEAPSRYVPIAALNPYQGRWTIKARVTFKGDIRKFHNAKGEGKVFSFDVLDAEGGEIRVTCFNDVADLFYERIEIGGIYKISNGSLKAAQRTFNHLKNDWEIFLENSSTVESCIDEDASIPHQQFDFKTISNLGNLESNSMVDVVGVVVAINPTTIVMRKNGTEVQKRSLQLRDASGCSVELTMWGPFCESEGQQLQGMCDTGTFPVLAVKGGRISDFGGKSIGTVASSHLLINPNVPQAMETKAWFEQGGKNTTSQSISRDISIGSRLDMRKTVSQIKDDGLGRSEKPDWIALRATISFIKTDTFCYTACPLPIGDRQCNKKVVSSSDGTWRCDRCDKTIAECDYRYLLSIQVQDHTGVTWITAFQDAGEEIMGLPAKDLFNWKENESPQFRDVIQKLLFNQYVFKLKIKEEHYNDELRVKCTVIKSEKLDFGVENKALIDTIGKVSKGELEYAASSAGMPLAKLANGTTQGSSGQLGPLKAGYKGEFRSTGLTNGYAKRGTGAFGGTACLRCGGPHSAGNCPSEWGINTNVANYGAFNATVGSPISCFKCGQGGHWARECLSYGMNGNFCREANYVPNAGIVSHGLRRL